MTTEMNLVVRPGLTPIVTDADFLSIAEIEFDYPKNAFWADSHPTIQGKTLKDFEIPTYICPSDEKGGYPCSSEMRKSCGNYGS